MFKNACKDLMTTFKSAYQKTGILHNAHQPFLYCVHTQRKLRTKWVGVHAHTMYVLDISIYGNRIL